MATIDLGKIAITPEGKWSAGKYYEKLSLVIFNGQSYLSLRDTTGDNPETSRSDWMQITSRGESLYQMMVREGKFVGTEEEFLQQYLDSLKACADASEEVRAALSDILDEMDRVRAEISEVMVEEDIRIKNEAKREAAEINRRNAEITRGVEERNRQEAEQRREQSMQQIQNDAEIALAMAAEAQQKAEEAILNEEERISAENQRKIDEATRIQHEEQRVNDEAMRRSREADRLESENIRQKNEGDRILAEREREEIMRNLVEELKGLAANKFKIVDVLPEVGEFAVIYLVPSTTPSDNDVYDEWAYVSEKWEHIGSTRFKIDSYFTKEEVERLLAIKQDTLTPGNGISIEGNVIGVTSITESESQPHTSLWVNPSEDEETDVTYNRSQIDALLNTKQNTVVDLDEIRSNAQNASNTIASIVEAGYVFAGIAAPKTNPGTPNTKVFYIANGKGTYTNFGGLEVTEDEVVILYYDSSWHKMPTGIASQAKLTELEGEVDDLLPMSRLYKSFLPISGETKAGVVYADNRYFTPNDSAGENLVFQVTAGVTYMISLTIARVAPTFGCVSFLSGDSYPTSNVYVDEIIKVCDAMGAYETNYTPASNGYIIIFQKYNNVIYSSIATVKSPQYTDFQAEINEIDVRVDGVEEGIASVENKIAVIDDAFDRNQTLTDKSNSFTVDMWAYVDGTTGLISGQPESTGRRVIAYKATAGQKYRIISGILLNNTVYTFLAFFPGQTAPVTGNYATVIKKYNGTNTDITLPIEQDGWIMLGFISNQVFQRMQIDWRLYLYDIINPGAKLSLPEKVNGVVGDTLQVFRRSIVDAIDPYSFDLSIKCDNGRIYPRYYEFTPSSAGTVRLNAQLKNSVGQILDEGYMDIIVSSAPSSPSSMKRIAVFGDSLTQGGQYVKEVVRRLLSSDGETPGFPAGKGLSNIKFIGAMGEGNAKYYGVGGWNWNNYATEGSPAFRFQVTGVTTIVKGAVYSNNGHQYTVMENNTTNGVGNILCSTSDSVNVPQTSGILTKVSGGGDANINFTSVEADQQNPLWDEDKQEISFVKYLNNIGETTVDCVYFLLGWNGFSYDYPGSTKNSGPYIRNILDALHTQFPSAIVRILGLQLPSLNGGLGANYGASGKYSDLYWLIKQVQEYNAFLASIAGENGYSEFVEYVDVASQFDSENNMPEAETMVNTRNTSKKEWRGTNGVHPANPGYMQIADVVYRKVVNDFC